MMNMEKAINRLPRGSRALVTWIMCLSGTLFFFYEYILIIEPSIMQESLQGYFGIATAGAWGSLIGVYYFSYTPMQLFAGPLTDTLGPRRCLCGALIICVSGLFLFYVTNLYYVAAIGRFMIGFGSAFAFVGAMRLAVVWLPAHRTGLFAGITLGAAMLGAVTGSVFVGQLVQTSGWRHTLDYTLYAGLILIPVLLIMAQDQYQRYFADQKLHPKAIGAKLGQVFVNGQIWVAGIVGCFIYIVYTGIGLLWGIPFLERVYEFPHSQCTELISLIFIGGLIGSPFMGWFSDRIKRRKWPLVGASAIALVVTLLLFYMPVQHFYYAAILITLYGFLGGGNVITFALAREHVGSERSGTAIAFTNMIIMLSGLVYQPFIGWLLDTVHSGSSTETIVTYTAAEYQQALSAIPVSLFIGMLLALFCLRETYARPVADHNRDITGE